VSQFRFVLATLTLACAACVGSDPECAPAELEPLEQEPAYAVLTSDFVTSAVALLDSDGSLQTGAWLDSGTRSPGLATALSGDAVLPTRPLADGKLTVIDRLGVDALTCIDVPEGEVRGQIPLTPDSGQSMSAFRANPRDALPLSSGRALVSRFEKNRNPEADPLDQGNDLVVVELDSETLKRRIALDPLDTEQHQNGTTLPIPARPARMVRSGRRVVVGLARLSGDFTVAGPGAAAIVNLDTGEVTKLPLEGLANCPEVVPVPGEPNRAVIACAGPTFAQGPSGRRRAAGLAQVHVPQNGQARVEHVWRAADHPDAPVLTHGAVTLGDGTLVAVAMGGEGTGDRLVHVDLRSGGTRTVLRTDEPFVLGPGTYDPEGGLLLVPDASAGVRRWRVHSGANFEPIRTVDASPCRDLGAREIRPL
jgi:hypothetical protein